MTTVITRCHQCGAEFEPTSASIRAGSWRECDACAPKTATPNRCTECGRELRLTTRTICLGCLTGDTTV